MANALHVESQLRPIALLTQSDWDYDGHGYSRVECTARLCVQFEDHYNIRSRFVGALFGFHVLGLCAFSSSQLIATYTPRMRMWRIDGTHEHWPVMLVSPAEERRAINSLASGRPS